MKILIVEDEPAIAEGVTVYAALEGSKTLWAADGNRVLHHGPGQGHGAHGRKDGAVNSPSSS